MWARCIFVVLLAAAGCSSKRGGDPPPNPDATSGSDAGVKTDVGFDDPDAGFQDADEPADAGFDDAGSPIDTGVDAGFASSDGGFTDAGVAPLELIPDHPLIGELRSFPARVRLNAPADENGVAVDLSSDDPNIVFFTPTQTFVAPGELQAVVTVTGNQLGATTLRAQAPGYEEATAQLTVTDQIINIAPFGAVAPQQSVGLAVSLSAPATAGGVTIDFVTSDPSIATVTSSIFVPGAEQTGATNPTLTGVALGTTEVVATTPGFAPKYSDIVVTLGIDLLPTPVPVVLNDPSPVEIRLSAPAPAGGLIVELSIDDPGVATAPAVAMFLPGETSTEVSLTGVSVGTTTLRASAGGGVATAVTDVNVFSGRINVPPTLLVGPGAQSSLSLSTSVPAPVGGWTISLESSDPTVATVPASVTIPEGQTVPTANPQVTGVTFGTAIITADAADLLPGEATVDVAIDLTLSDDAYFVVNGSQTAATLNLSSPAPAGGFSVSLSIDDTSVGTVPAVLDIPAGQTSANFDITGLTNGTTTLRANAAGALEATAEVTVGDAPTISIVDQTIGKDLQTSLSGTLSLAAPAGGVDVTLTSQDPTKVLLSTNATGAGSASIVRFVGAGSRSVPTFYVQALDASGTVEVTASAPDYTEGSFTVTLNPSGFAVQSPSVINTTRLSNNTGINVRPFRLQPTTLARSQSQPIRGGLTVNVDVTSSDPSVGVVTPVPVVFGPNISSANTAFDPLTVGTTTLEVVTPASFQTPPDRTQIPVTVDETGFTFSDRTIGKDLQDSQNSGRLEAPAPVGNVVVTLTSQDPTKVLLSTDDQTTGSASITRTVAASQTAIPIFYVQALDRTGTVDIVATAPGLADGRFTVTLAPSGFVYASGSTSNIATTTASNPTRRLVQPARLSSSTNNFSQFQNLRPGLTVSVPIVSTETTVGVANPSTLVFTRGSEECFFEPVGAGTTSLRIDPPAGFDTPNNRRQIEVTVTAPGFSLANETVGRELQDPVTGWRTSAPAPAGNLTVTVVSLDPSKVLLSQDGNQSGTESINLSVPAGSTSVPSFFVQGLSDVGTATLAVAAPGFTPGEAYVTLVPSGFVFFSGSGNNISTTTFANDVSRSIASARLNPTTLDFAGYQPLRGGRPPVEVSILSSDPSVGTITVSPVQMLPNVSTTNTAFDPAAAGVSTLSIVTPMGFSTPNNRREILATVSAPAITVSDERVGRDLIEPMSIGLATAPPVPTDVTVTVSAPSIATISRDQSTAGTSSLVFSGITGTNVGTVYVHGLALGNTVVTVSAAGYTDGTGDVTVDPSGFVYHSSSSSNISTTTFSANINRTVSAARLDPSTLNFQRYQRVRPGVTVTVPLQSSEEAVGDWVQGSLTFVGGTTSLTLTDQFDPVSAGTTDLTISTPSTFSTPSNRRAIQATVTAPAISVENEEVGEDLQELVTVSLGAAPPTATDFTISISDSSIAEVSPDASTVGTASFVRTHSTGTSLGSVYVHGRSIGTAQISVTGPSYSTGVGTIRVDPSGFVYHSSSGNPITTTTFAPNISRSIAPARLDAIFFDFVQYQQLRAGFGPVSVAVDSSDEMVGVIIGSPLSFPSGQTTQTLQFDPLSPGVTDLTIQTPPGFDTPSDRRQVRATVNAPAISFSGVTPIGEDLQDPVTVRLANAPPAPVDVTVTSADPSVALLSLDPLVLGQSSVTFSDVSSTSVGTVYVYGISTGSTMITASAPGYSTVEQAIDVRPSGYIVRRPTGTSFSTTTLSGNTNVTVCASRLNPTTLRSDNVCQPLRAGVSADVTVNSVSSPFGRIINNPLSFTANVTELNAVFDPLNPGSTLLQVEPPPGFDTPSDRREITAIVDSPDVQVDANVAVGRDLQEPVTIRLEVVPPNPVTVVVTSNAPSIATVSTDPTQAGSTSVTFPDVQGTTTVGTVYIQGLALGDTTITFQAPGYDDGTTNVAVDPSGFVFQNPTTNFAIGATASNRTIQVRPARLVDGTLDYAEGQSIRGGLGPVSVPVTSSDPSTGVITVSPLSFGANASTLSTAFDPLAPGTTTLSVGQPTGFDRPATRRSLVVTVNP